MTHEELLARQRAIREKQEREAIQERERLNALRNSLDGNSATTVETAPSVTAAPVEIPSQQDVVTETVEEEKSSVPEASEPVAEQVSENIDVTEESSMGEEVSMEEDMPVASQEPQEDSVLEEVEQQTAVQEIAPEIENKPVKNRQSGLNYTEITGDTYVPRTAVNRDFVAPKSPQPVVVEIPSEKKSPRIKQALSSDNADERKMVRGVSNSAVALAVQSFPLADNIGDAVSAYIIAHSDVRPEMPESIKKLVDSYEEDSVVSKLLEENLAMNKRLARIENTMKSMISALQELEIGTAYLIADRKGLTKERPDVTVGGKSLNLLEPTVTDTMQRMHEQSRQYLNLQRLADGRPKR